MKKCFYYIILLAAFTFMACSASRTPHSAAKHFYSSIAEGEYDEALAITTLKEDADPEIYYAIMEKVSRSIAERGGVERVEIVEERMAEDQATAVVTALIHYTNGEQHEEMCDVVKVEDEWRIDVNLDSK